MSFPLEQLGLFAEELPDRFATAKERYGVWPTTVWDCDLSDPVTRRLKESIGDDGSAREGCFTAVQGGGPSACNRPKARPVGANGCDASVYRGVVTTSIFNPAVAAWVLNMYAPTEGLCFDPFAGGGTRAIMAAKHGLEYVGVELRSEEVASVEDRAHRAGCNGNVRIHRGDARDCSGLVESATADFLLTCPPYWNLEQYNGGAADLSMLASYDEFCCQLGRVVYETARVLKPGAFSCWVVGLHRDSRGSLMALHHDVARLHRSAGFRFKEEVILAQRNNGAIQRVGNFEKGDKRLIRTHEYLLVFVR